MQDKCSLRRDFSPIRIRSPVQIGAVVLSGAVAACQSTPTAIPDSTGKAIVRAYGGGAANWLAMTLKPIGESHQVSISVVNGDDARRFGNDRQILLTPGHYAIGVQCLFKLDSLEVSTVGVVTADVIAGHTYFVDGGLSAQDHKVCIASVVDTTSDSH